MGLLEVQRQIKHTGAEVSIVFLGKKTAALTQKIEYSIPQCSMFINCCTSYCSSLSLHVGSCLSSGEP